MCSNTHIPQMSSQEAAEQASSLPAVCIRRGLMDRDFVTVHQRHLRDIRPRSCDGDAGSLARPTVLVAASRVRQGMSHDDGMYATSHKNGRGREGRRCEALVYLSCLGHRTRCRSTFNVS